MTTTPSPGVGEWPAPPAEHQAIIEWAVSRWKAEVAKRPMRNIHRRALDTKWRQVIRYLGGNPDDECGPSHDDLMKPAPGMVCVPVEPTVDMVEAGRAALSQGDAKVQTHARVMWVWEAMIAAALASKAKGRVG